MRGGQRFAVLSVAATVPACYYVLVDRTEDMGEITEGLADGVPVASHGLCLTESVDISGDGPFKDDISGALKSIGSIK